MDSESSLWCLPPRRNIHSPEDDFYYPGSLLCQSFSKWTVTEPKQDGIMKHIENEDRNCTHACGAGGCVESFTSLADLSNHFLHSHMYACTMCSSVYASYRLLSIHTSECHDSYFAVLAETKKMYACIVEGCEKEFWNDSRRKLHLMAKHKFPESFSFNESAENMKKSKCKTTAKKLCKYFSKEKGCKFGIKCKFLHPIKQDGIEPAPVDSGKTAPLPDAMRLLHHRNDTKTTGNNGEARKDEDVEMEDLEAKIGTLNLSVPEKISFGRRHRDV